MASHMPPRRFLKKIAPEYVYSQILQIDCSIRNIMGVTYTVVDDIQTIQLIWHGQVRTMWYERLPKHILFGNNRVNDEEDTLKKLEGRSTPGNQRKTYRKTWAWIREQWQLGVGRHRRTL